MTQKINKLPNHPLFKMNKEIERRGILVIDSTVGIPPADEPVATPHLMISLCHSGSSKGEYDMKPMEVRAHDYAVVYPDHPVMGRSTSEDYTSTLIILSDKLYAELRPRLAYGNNQIFHSRPFFHLNTAYYNCVKQAIELLRSVTALDIPTRNNLIADTLDLLSRLTENVRKNLKPSENAVILPRMGHTRTLFSQFYDLLNQHYREHRDVAFYARQVCLSPKYFGHLIKQDIGITVSQCILRYVTIQAKTILRHRPELTIQEVGYELGFEDSTIFSRYFKSGAGLSPSEYRKTL